MRDLKENTEATMDDRWVRGPIRSMMKAHEQSLREHPPIPPGASDIVDPLCHGICKGALRRAAHSGRSTPTREAQAASPEDYSGVELQHLLQREKRVREHQP